MDKTFRILVSRAGVNRTANFDGADRELAWDAFLEGIREGATVYLFENNDLVAFMLDPTS
jgi:hypothetical protein